eukprot:TRINITY_DN1583_c0_g1_i2.p1 TRINITY_DN1583_c0_g1~~TRINITY_DN1583_c0_g1_i2.p1  ORF type:complete len:563 (+),score=62.63 TRINITY_DN1583_c0_g1_i2:549-2237(+)
MAASSQGQRREGEVVPSPSSPSERESNVLRAREADVDAGVGLGGCVGEAEGESSERAFLCGAKRREGAEAVGASAKNTSGGGSVFHLEIATKVHSAPSAVEGNAASDALDTAADAHMGELRSLPLSGAFAFSAQMKHVSHARSEPALSSVSPASDGGISHTGSCDDLAPRSSSRISTTVPFTATSSSPTPTRSLSPPSPHAARHAFSFPSSLPAPHTPHNASRSILSSAMHALERPETRISASTSPDQRHLSPLLIARASSLPSSPRGRGSAHLFGRRPRSPSPSRRHGNPSNSHTRDAALGRSLSEPPRKSPPLTGSDPDQPATYALTPSHTSYTTTPPTTAATITATTATPKAPPTITTTTTSTTTAAHNSLDIARVPLYSSRVRGAGTSAMSVCEAPDGHADTAALPTTHAPTRGGSDQSRASPPMSRSPPVGPSDATFERVHDHLSEGDASTSHTSQADDSTVGHTGEDASVLDRDVSPLRTISSASSSARSYGGYAPAEVLLEGFFTKWSTSTILHAQRRYFVVTTTHLFYFKRTNNTARPCCFTPFPLAFVWLCNL